MLVNNCPALISIFNGKTFVLTNIGFNLITNKQDSTRMSWGF